MGEFFLFWLVQDTCSRFLISPIHKQRELMVVELQFR